MGGNITVGTIVIQYDHMIMYENWEYHMCDAK